jgi:hypothetical protein
MDWPNAYHTIYHLLWTNVRMEEFAKGWAAAFDVVTIPWWGRAWVFQEFMVSAQVVFLYGRHSMPYTEFMELVTVVSRWDVFEKIGCDPKRHLKLHLYGYNQDRLEKATSKMFRLLFAKLKESSTSDLKLLLLLTRDCQASDVRDKLYSLLGLADPGYGIVPDYSADTDIHNLLVETTKSIIISEDSLDVLSFQDRHNPARPNSTGLLPSWVLDWSNSASLGHIYELSHREHASIDIVGYRPNDIMPASPDASFVQVPHPYRPGTQTTVLQVWAVLLDNDFRRIQVGGTPWFNGARNYEILYDNEFMVENDFENDCELWLLRGAAEPFLLSKFFDGYQVIRPIICYNLYWQLRSVPGVMNDYGELDVSKMQETRITIF